MQTDLNSLLAIVAVAAAVPLITGLTRFKVADVVLLLIGGIVIGPQVLGFVHLTDAINLLSELGLAMLFLLAGLEIDSATMRDRGGRKAAIGWFVSLALGIGVAVILNATAIISDAVGVTIALVSTALGTLLPILRDRGELDSPFGKRFLAAGAWGEFGPVVAISVLLGIHSTIVDLIVLLVFVLIAGLVALTPGRLSSPRLTRLIERGYATSAQTGVRLVMLLLVLLLTIASGFGLDVVLGAFAAGIILRRLAPPEEGSPLLDRVAAIAFGVFIPIFFVTSGSKLDISAIIENPLLLVLFVALLLLVRGLPQMFVYRSEFATVRERARFSLYVATGLPIIVAVTSLELSNGIMRSSTAAALVGAGAVSVMLFPAIGNALVRGERRRPSTTQSLQQPTH